MYTIAEPASSFTLDAMLRGTEMSTKRRTPPTTEDRASMLSTSALWMSSSSEPLAAKITSAASTHFIRSGIRWMLNLTSGNSAASASARGMLRLRMVTSLQPLDARCLTSSVDILPAPMMQTLQKGKVTVLVRIGTTIHTS